MPELSVEAVLSGRVVGRERELALIEVLLEGRAERPAALVFEGEAGIGKTSIVQAALDGARGVGLRVFAARPAAGEMELPHAALGDLLAGVDEGVLSRLAVPQRVAIEAALRRGPSMVAADAHALSRGVLELLRLEGGAGDLLIVVDDAQWLDRPTASALTFAFRRIGAVPIRVLVAFRTEAGAEGVLPLGLEDWVNALRVAIEPLSATELGAVVRQRVGVQLPRPRLEELHRSAGGNPMFAIELEQYGPDQPGRRAATLPLALGARLGSLNDSTRATLAIAAAALRPSTALLERAGAGREGIRSAIATGIVQLNGDRLFFTHPLLRTAAYESLLPAERQEIHMRLAAASTDVVERGYHVARAAVAPDGAAADALQLAATSAAQLGDHAGAAAFLLRAVEISPDRGGDAAAGLELRAAAELEAAGDVAQAADLAQSLISRLGPGSARAQARRILVSSSVGASMSYEDSLAELALALDDAADEETAALLHVMMADYSCGMCRLEESVGHARTAFELAERAGATATQVTALGYLGFDECLLGLGVSDAARRAFERWDGRIVLASGYSPRMALGCVCIHATRFSEAENLFREELAMAEERGLEALEVIARAHLAEAQLRAGRWERALANGRSAVEHARQAANAQTVTGVSYPLAMAQAMLGHHADARALAGEALVAAEATDDFWFRISHRSVLGLVALAEDDPQRAAEVLEPAWSLMLERGLGDLSIFPVGHVLGEALVALGRLDDAEAVAGTLRACPVGEQPWCRAMANRLLGLVASARGDQAGARAAIAAALEAHRELPEPFEHARTLQLAGRVERRARNWRAARESLAAALERFDELGAAQWAEKTGDELARLPGRRPLEPRLLTPREQEVAELVTAGLANKEIAARLSVSVHTVEKHLTRAYAKLGVRSRGQLSQRISTGA